MAMICALCASRRRKHVCPIREQVELEAAEGFAPPVKPLGFNVMLDATYPTRAYLTSNIRSCSSL